jgi:hypothetical protein
VIQEYVIACIVSFCVIVQLCWIYIHLSRVMSCSTMLKGYMMGLCLLKETWWLIPIMSCGQGEHVFFCLWNWTVLYYMCTFYVPIIHYYCCPTSYWSNISATWLWMTYHLWMIVESYRELISRVKLGRVKSVEHPFSDSVSFCMYTVTFWTLQHI